MFNKDNTEWKDGTGSLILGQKPALLDSINRKHKVLFDLYKKQKEIDWSEDEINLNQSRIDFTACPKPVYDLMLKNLAFQWELDSVASRSVSVLFAPFITDSDFWLAVSKNGEIENTHSLTYADIGKICLPDATELYKEVMECPDVLSRADTVTSVLKDLQKAGAEYSLGLVENNQELYNKVFMGLVAIYCLERIQFMASFASTFSVVELDYFQGIGSLVQKIMQDEYYIHCRVWEYVLKVEMNTHRGIVAFMSLRDKIEKLISEIVQREYDWNNYLFNSVGRVSGYNELLANEWVDWNAQDVYMLFSITPPMNIQVVNPLPFMDKWLDLDKFQNANQEGDNNNYRLNCFVNDIPEGKTYEWY